MISLWFAAILCLATLGLEHLLLALIRFIWPPVIVVPSGVELDLEALMNGQRVLIVPSKPQRWVFK